MQGVAETPASLTDRKTSHAVCGIRQQTPHPGVVLPKQLLLLLLLQALLLQALLLQSAAAAAAEL